MKEIIEKAISYDFYGDKDVIEKENGFRIFVKTTMGQVIEFGYDSVQDKGYVLLNDHSNRHGFFCEFNKNNFQQKYEDLMIENFCHETISNYLDAFIALPGMFPEEDTDRLRQNFIFELSKKSEQHRNETANAFLSKIIPVLEENGFIDIKISHEGKSSKIYLNSNSDSCVCIAAEVKGYSNITIALYDTENVANNSAVTLFYHGNIKNSIPPFVFEKISNCVKQYSPRIENTI